MVAALKATLDTDVFIYWILGPIPTGIALYFHVYPHVTVA
jgi:hypothetical protein